MVVVVLVLMEWAIAQILLLFKAKIHNLLSILCERKFLLI